MTVNLVNTLLKVNFRHNLVFIYFIMQHHVFFLIVNDLEQVNKLLFSVNNNFKSHIYNPTVVEGQMFVELFIEMFYFKIIYT